MIQGFIYLLHPNSKYYHHNVVITHFSVENVGPFNFKPKKTKVVRASEQCTCNFKRRRELNVFPAKVDGRIAEVYELLQLWGSVILKIKERCLH